jgi:hypothetical protein
MPDPILQQLMQPDDSLGQLFQMLSSVQSLRGQEQQINQSAQRFPQEMQLADLNQQDIREQRSDRRSAGYQRDETHKRSIDLADFNLGREKRKAALQDSYEPQDREFQVLKILEDLLTNKAQRDSYSAHADQYRASAANQKNEVAAMDQSRAMAEQALGGGNQAEMERLIKMGNWGEVQRRFPEFFASTQQQGGQ